MKTKQKRKAIHSELVEASKNNPGYFKYVITIQELDGTIHKVPAYGTDMQDAIAKLVRTEQSNKLKKVYINKVEPTVIILMAIAWMSSVLISSISGNYQYAYWAVISLFSIVTSYGIVKMILNNTKNGKSKF